MKINGNELKPGYVIHHKGKVWTVVNTTHVKPGKGPAYMQAELKEVLVGTKLNERFRADQSVERAHTEEQPFQFLYADGDMLALMNTETFDQETLPRAMLGDAHVFLQESMLVTVSFCDGKPIAVRLPKTVTLKVVESDPVVKGQTVTASFKPAVLENGVKIMVPPHIETGTAVVINTEDSTYLERAKNAPS